MFHSNYWIIVLVAIFVFTSPKLGKIRIPRTGELEIGGEEKEKQEYKKLTTNNIRTSRES